MRKVKEEKTKQEKEFNDEKLLSNKRFLASILAFTGVSRLSGNSVPKQIKYCICYGSR